MARVNNDQIDFLSVEDCWQVVTFRRSTLKLMLARIRVEKTANCIEVTEVQCENFCGSERLRGLAMRRKIATAVATSDARSRV